MNGQSVLFPHLCCCLLCFILSFSVYLLSDVSFQLSVHFRLRYKNFFLSQWFGLSSPSFIPFHATACNRSLSLHLWQALEMKLKRATIRCEQLVEAESHARSQYDLLMRDKTDVIDFLKARLAMSSFFSFSFCLLSCLISFYFLPMVSFLC